MKICLVGEGAQGDTHMEALAEIEGVEVVTVAGGIQADLEAFAGKWNIPHYSLSLEECLRQPGVDAVINGGPSQLHVEQTRLAMEHGKHVLLEIPMALNLEDAQVLTDLAAQSGLANMVCHTNHYSAPLRELKRKIQAGELHLHHIVFQRYFFRRVNLNRFGKPRTWKDDLLWHHGCHEVDMVAWLLDDVDVNVWGQVGPLHSELKIPMDLTIAMKSKKTGTIATIAHSFNNHGPIRVPVRFIGEEETYLYERGVLKTHEGEEISRATMKDSVIMQNKEFFAAIKEGREAETSFANCLKSQKLLDKIQRIIDADS
jgi:2-hydroxy-4-carboxymuconate semialdehyde hemiacetal dehydrogenase